jgi:hypothetical protein
VKESLNRPIYLLIALGVFTLAMGVYTTIYDGTVWDGAMMLFITGAAMTGMGIDILRDRLKQPK